MYYALGTDKESTTSNVQILTIIPNKRTDKDKFSYLREGLLSSFFNSMIANRLSEIMQQSNPPYLGGSISYGGLVEIMPHIPARLQRSLMRKQRH